jgi:hypothetical protein
MAVLKRVTSSSRMLACCPADMLRCCCEVGVAVERRGVELEAAKVVTLRRLRSRDS